MRLGKIVASILLLTVLVSALLPSTVAFAQGAQGEEERLGVGEGASALDNKKVLFIGCSYMYYGGLVERTGANRFEQDVRTEGETGFFKRLCAENGVKNVQVTDWTYGGHDLTDLFGGNCDADDYHCTGRDHLADLVDKDYDYVIILDIASHCESAEKFYNNAVTVGDMFKEANPDVKLYYMLYTQYYSSKNEKYSVLRKVTEPLRNYGYTVIDWGAVCYDVMNGNTQVPGATQEYNKQSFVVSNDKSDGHHQNLLAGYLATIMTYATITGETTVGQPYKWIYPLSSKYLNIDRFIKDHYKYDDPATPNNEAKTNMKEIFYSDADMLGLQTVCEQYLSKTRWLDFAEYTVEFVDDENNVISSEQYKWHESIRVPEDPEKPSDDKYSYTFIGWDKEISDCEGDAVYVAEYSKAPAGILGFFDMIGNFFADIIEWFASLFSWKK